ncbi:MAG: penicillin-binding protein 2 [Rubrivivax sp.]|nr:penicillin-binding protein 2 [Rubrivivax sp.]
MSAASSRGSSGRAALGSARRLNYATSPLLASKTPPWRSRFVVVMMALGCAVLLGRAAWVQLIDAPFYVAKGESRYAYKMPLIANRGRILDRNGNVLATSVPVPSVWIAPKEFRESGATAAQRTALARLLNMPLAELDERSQSRGEFVWLRRKIDEPVWQQIRQLKLKGVYQQREFLRKYYEGETIAQVVGRTNFIEDNGTEGIELRFDRQLQGQNGEHRVVRNRLGQVVDEMAERREPVNGTDVQLSLDSRIQFFTWHAVREAVDVHGALSGSAVVVDARTGELLALANVAGAAALRSKDAMAERQRNRALTDTFEPGSTMKPFVVSWAMESRKLTPLTSLPNEPLPVAGGLFVRDSHPLAKPRITLAEVIQRSSNAGTARLAMQMERKEMHGLMTNLGFGQRPQIDFPGAAAGRLRKPESWMPIDQATMSYGYGLSTSLLQLARAYTVFAHDGQLSELSLLKRDAPMPSVPVISPETARQMRQMLGLVVQEGGTAPKAAVEGYSVGGKTGTAQAHVKGGYDKSRHRAFFVGLAPLSDPRIVVAVMLDEPRAQGVYYGGAVAAPVFSKVTQQTLRTLGVEQDLEVRARVRVQTETTP